MLLVVTVKKLNKRKSVPTNFQDRDSIIGEVTEGFRFEGVEAARSEIPNSNLGKWYKDRDGYFYWGGGVVEEIVNLIGTSQTNYNLQIEDIPGEWKATHGNNIQVAILDTGFTAHADLQNNIIDTFNAVDNSINVKPSANDHPDHGNNVAGLIAASSNLAAGITGIAPRAKLILVKISNNGFIEPLTVLNALEYVLNRTNAKIINLSFSLDENDYNPYQERFNSLFAIAKQKKVIIVASAGDNSGLLNNRNHLLLPSNEEYCAAVGTINQPFLQSNPNPVFHQRLDLIIPNQSLKSCAGLVNDYSTINNSSMAAAITSGVSALLYSYLKNPSDTDAFNIKLREPLKIFNSDLLFTLSIHKL